MSFSSTLRNIFRRPKPQETRLTISITFQDGSGAFNYPVSLPPFAESMLENGQLPQHVAIWKHYEPQSAIGSATKAPLQLCHLYCFRPNPSLETDGLLEMKPSASERLQ